MKRNHSFLAIPFFVVTSGTFANCAQQHTEPKTLPLVAPDDSRAETDSAAGWIIGNSDTEETRDGGLYFYPHTKSPFSYVWGEKGLISIAG